MIPRSLSHVAVGVRDMDRSLPFYRDLLGFEVAQEINDLDGNENHLGGISERQNRKYRVVVLRYGPETAALYGFNEAASVVSLVAPLGPPPTGTGINVDQIGISHFGIWVKGLDTIYEDLKSKGVTFAVPPHAAVKTAAGTLHSAFLHDPDGILIELQEMLPP